MSAPETPSSSDPVAPAAPEHDQDAAFAPQPAGNEPPRTPHRRPWGWIAVAGLLAAGIIGLGIHAINVNSDLDDANAHLDSQQDQIEQAQDTGAGVAAAAKAAFDDLSAELGAAQQDADQAAEQAA